VAYGNRYALPKYRSTVGIAQLDIVVTGPQREFAGAGELIDSGKRETIEELIRRRASPVSSSPTNVHKRFRRKPPREVTLPQSVLLSVGFDPELLRVRNELLQKAGYNVQVETTNCGCSPRIKGQRYRRHRDLPHHSRR